MVETLTVAVAMAACLGAAALTFGDAPTRVRVVRTTLLGILAAVVAWLLIGTVLDVPESGVAPLGVWLIGLAVAVARSGTRRSAPGTA
jgi:hypothetical protein